MNQHYENLKIENVQLDMDNNYQLLINFRKKISDESFTSKIVNDENLGNIEFELKKIERIVSTILIRIDREKKK